MAQYIVSARKYRPDNFESLIGQDNIAQTLKNSILRGQLAHAYLFCGPRGVGKTSTARIFAKTINCSDPSAEMEPCGKCESCMSFAEGRSYCIHELDAASNNGVDDIKALMDQVRIPPQVGRYSVYIIDEVHMLSQAAFNAFLKTLEEPPAHAIFILATTEKHKILPTILSRCQTYDFNRITVENIVRNLRGIAGKEGISIDDESLHVIAGKADGAMRDALTIFDQTVAFCGTDVKYQDVLKNLNVLDYEYSFGLVDAFLSGNYPATLLTFDEILSKGFNALHFITALSSHFRDLIVSRSAGLDALLELPDSLKKRYKEQADRCPLKFLYDALGITTQCESGYRASVNPRLHIEVALMKLSFLMSAPAQSAQVQSAPSQSAQVQASALQAAPAPQPYGSQPAAPLSAQPAVQPAAQPAAWTRPAPAPQQPASPAAQTVTSASPAPESSGFAPAPQPAVPVQGPVPDAASQAVPAPVPEPQPRTRRSRAAAASALAIDSIMSEKDKPARSAAPQISASSQVILTEPVLKAKWEELAAMYDSKPRLASTIRAAKLEFDIKDDGAVVTFSVSNQAQKDWIEVKCLFEMEGRYQQLTGSPSVNLRVSILPEEEVVRKAYMPSEKAKELMEANEEVRNLVTDLAFDIK